METAFRSEEIFTQEEFWEWLQERPPSDIHHYELIHGRIVMSPPAGWPHGRLGARLVARLSAHVEGWRLGIVLYATAGFDLPTGDTLEPDVSFIGAERFAAGPEPRRGRFLRIVPNLAVEILSRSTARRDCTEKHEIYARAGVEEYWIVDPDRREVAVFSLEGERFGPARVVASGPLPSRLLGDLVLTVEDLFADAV